MRKFTLVLVTMFSLGLIVPAAAINSTDQPIDYVNTYDHQITFNEGGISFSIFQNGEFDFYLNHQTGVSANARVGNVSISFNAGYDYDAYVQYDDYGAIIQIEDVPIYYDHYGRIIQAGDVRIKYHSSRVVRVGGLNIFYNAYGQYSHYNGYINQFNRHYVFNPFHEFFVRPLVSRCIVSYNPYRRFYTPKRYKFWGYKGRTAKASYKAPKRYNTRRTFKPIDRRIRTTQQRTASRSSSQTVRRDVRNSRTNQTTVGRRNTAQRSTGNTSRGNQQATSRKPAVRRTTQANASQRTAKKPVATRSTTRSQGKQVQTQRKVQVTPRTKTPTRNATVRRTNTAAKTQVRKPVTRNSSSKSSRSVQASKKRSTTKSTTTRRTRQ